MHKGSYITDQMAKWNKESVFSWEIGSEREVLKQIKDMPIKLNYKKQYKIDMKIQLGRNQGG